MIKQLKVTYDADVDAAYIFLADIVAGDVASTYCCDPKEVGAMINLDFDSEGRLLGIEVLGARSKLASTLLQQAEDS